MNETDFWILILILIPIVLCGLKTFPKTQITRIFAYSAVLYVVYTV